MTGISTLLVSDHFTPRGSPLYDIFKGFPSSSNTGSDRNALVKKFFQFVIFLFCFSFHFTTAVLPVCTDNLGNLILMTFSCQSNELQ